MAILQVISSLALYMYVRPFLLCNIEKHLLIASHVPSTVEGQNVLLLCIIEMFS